MSRLKIVSGLPYKIVIESWNTHASSSSQEVLLWKDDVRGLKEKRERSQSVPLTLPASYVLLSVSSWKLLTRRFRFLELFNGSGLREIHKDQIRWSLSHISQTPCVTRAMCGHIPCCVIRGILLQYSVSQRPYCDIWVTRAIFAWLLWQMASVIVWLLRQFTHKPQSPIHRAWE